MVEITKENTRRYNQLIAQGVLPGAALKIIDTENTEATAEAKAAEKKRLSDEKKAAEEKAKLQKQWEKEYKAGLAGRGPFPKGSYPGEEVEEEKIGVKSDLKTYGGSFVGEAGGFIGGLIGLQYLGTSIEKSVTDTSMLGGFLKWAANNIPKVILYTILKRYVDHIETEGPFKGLMKGLYIAMPTSIVLDTYSRIVGNSLICPTANLSEQDKLNNLQNDILNANQENIILKAHLNSGLKRLAEAQQKLLAEGPVNINTQKIEQKLDEVEKVVKKLADKDMKYSFMNNYSHERILDMFGFR